MVLLFLIAEAIIPPIIAARGKLYRGLWFALCIIMLAIGGLFFLELGYLYTQDTQAIYGPSLAKMQKITADLILLSLGASFGCFLAGCTFRQNRRER